MPRSAASQGLHRLDGHTGAALTSLSPTFGAAPGPIPSGEREACARRGAIHLGWMKTVRHTCLVMATNTVAQAAMATQSSALPIMLTTGSRSAWPR